MRGQWSGLIGIALVLSACHGVHLYEADRDATAQRAKTSFAAADISKFIPTLRSNHDENVGKEVATLHRYMRALRDAAYWDVILNGGYDTLLNEAGERLVVGPNAAFQFSVTVVRTQKEIQDSVRRVPIWAARAEAEIGLPVPSCDPAASLSNVPPANIAAAIGARPAAEQIKPTALYDAYVAECQTYAQRIGTHARLFDGIGRGEIKRRYERWEEARRDLALLRNAADNAKRAYDDAVKAYETARSQAEEASKSDLEKKAAERLQQLKGATAALQKAGDALGEEILAADRLEKIDSLIAALSGETPDPKLFSERHQAALRVVSQIPHLADELSPVIAGQRGPRLSPLLLERERQRHLHDDAANAVMLAVARVNLERELVDALVEEAHALRRARDEGQQANSLAANVMHMKLSAAFDSGVNAEARSALFRSLLHYGDSVVIARGRQQELRRRINALPHASALNRSETSVRLWQSTIAIPVDQIAAYHASGIKPETVGAMIGQALLLTPIYVGVNR